MGSTEFDIFRTATTADAAAIADLIAHADPGMTTLPKTPQQVGEYVAESEAYLAGDRSANRVFFVAERGGAVAGVSAIIPVLGRDRPFYSFRLSRRTRRSSAPELAVTYRTLHLTNDFDGYTELATLFLPPANRGGGLGRLLSYGRMAFIASHRDLFGDKLMAEIRGCTDADGGFPFWRHLAAKFIDLPYDEADQLSVADGRFIADLLPDLPILVNLLPAELADVIGRPNTNAEPAMRMLEQAGFRWSGLVDVFDGGPSVECSAGRTLIAATRITAHGFSDGSAENHSNAILSSGRLTDFRATLASADFDAHAVPADAQAGLGADTPEDILVSRAAEAPSRRTPPMPPQPHPHAPEDGHGG